MPGRRTGGSARERRGGSTRGQTTLDFAVGVSIFLLSLTSVLIFIPGTVAPFVEGGQEEIVTANRVADSLSEGLLGNPETPHVLNGTCTVAFFEDTSPDHCRFEGSNLTERIGVTNRQLVNVSLQSNISADGPGTSESTVLCWDTDDGPTPRLVERDSSACDTSETVTAIGPSPPDDRGTTVTARRVVQVNGTDVTMFVEMW